LGIWFEKLNRSEGSFTIEDFTTLCEQPSLSNTPIFIEGLGVGWTKDCYQELYRISERDADCVRKYTRQLIIPHVWALYACFGKVEAP